MRKGIVFGSVLIVSTLACGLVSGPQPAQSADSLSTLAQDLRQARDENRSSYQRYIWRAQHLVADATKDHSWSEIETSLANQGAKMERGMPEGTRQSYEFLFPDTDFVLPSGLVLKLNIRIDSHPETNPTKATTFQAQVMWVQLVSKVGKPLQETIDAKLFPEGSVVSELLKRPKLHEATRFFDVLDEVKIEFGVRGPPMSSFVSPDYQCPSGFALIVTFESVKDTETSSASFFYWSTSQLDPIMRADGKPLKPGAYIPQDTIGKVEPMYESSDSREPDQPSITSSRGLSSQQVLRRESAKTEARNLPPPDLRTVFSRADLEGLPASTKAIKIEGSTFGSADLTTLVRFQDLTYLDIGDGSFPASSLYILEKLKKLESLHLWDCELNPTLSVIIAALPKLRVANLGSENITDAEGIALSKSTSITQLIFWGCKKFTDRSLAAFADMQQLQGLRLPFRGERVYTSQGLSKLAKLKNLQSIGVSQTSPDEFELDFLKDMKKLESLSIDQWTMDKNALNIIASLPKIRTLSFWRVKGISDQNIAVISKLRELTWLSFRDCPAVTPKGVMALKKRLPPGFSGP